MNDLEIIRLFNIRNEGAIIQTKTKYGRVILHTAFEITMSKEDAEECENDTYVRLWDTIPPENPKSLKAYALVIVRRLALDVLRKRKRENKAFEELADCINDSIGEFETEDLSAVLNGFLKDLDEDNRKIFVARYFFSTDISSIAKSIGIAKPAVNMRLKRMREKLAKLLREQTDFLKGWGKK